MVHTAMRHGLPDAAGFEPSTVSGRRAALRAPSKRRGGLFASQCASSLLSLPTRRQSPYKVAIPTGATNLLVLSHRAMMEDGGVMEI
jgi:hypothetical protein